MALSLNDLKKRSQALPAMKPEVAKLPPKTKTLAPWEEIEPSVRLTKQSALLLNRNNDSVLANSTSVVTPARATTQVMPPQSEILESPMVIIPPVQAFERTEVDLHRSEGGLLRQDTKPQVVNSIQTESPNIVTRDEVLIPKPRKTASVRFSKDEVVLPDMVSDLGPSETFASLSGLQSKLVRFVFDSCLKRGGNETGPMSAEFVAKGVAAPFTSIKKTMQRLGHKRIIIRTGYKDGRGGWSRYKLHREIYQELLLGQAQPQSFLEVETNQRQGAPPVLAQVQPAPVINRAEITGEWAAIEIQPLEGINFTMTHVRQVALQGKLTSKELQDSIDFFAFDLSRNNKGRSIKGDPLNFFMGIVRRGAVYTPPPNYVSPTDGARAKYLAFLEAKERKREQEEKRILELQFMEWRRTLSLDQIRSICPDFAQRPGPAQNSFLSVYYEKNVHSSLVIDQTSGEANVVSSEEDDIMIRNEAHDALERRFGSVAMDGVATP